jgi:hypothetical protein
MIGKRYIFGIIMVGIFISLPGWLMLWSNPILGGMLIVFSIILQQLMVRAAKKHAGERRIEFPDGKRIQFKSKKEADEYQKQYWKEHDGQGNLLKQEPKRYRLEDLN